MDMRVYNGCPSDELWAYWDKINKLAAQLKNKLPTSWITYFPVEVGYMVAMWGKNGEFIQLSSKMHRHKIDAILEILERKES